MDINGMFAAANDTNTAVSSRALAGTAKLTEQTNGIMAAVLKALEGKNNDEVIMAKVKASTADHDEMDALLGLMHDFSTDDVQYLKDLGEDELDKMLKSQQSKRSRAKGKNMTMDNYKAMMQGALGELLIRQALGKEKSAGGAPTKVNGEYSDETLQKLAADQDALRKEIRNVQSKKSIMKSKADFKETDERWLLLLRQEAQLKGVRVDGAGGAPRVVEVDKTKDALLTLLAGKDPATMSKKELLDLVAQAQALTSEPTKDETQTTNEEQA